MNETGGIPSFSNRDRIYNDIAAPGLEILSILPRPLTARFPSCSEQGYSSCGPEEYREAQGTSFAAPQVTAAAAVLLSLRPDAPARAGHEDPASRRRSTSTRRPAAPRAETGRDAYSGWGRLDVAAGDRRTLGTAPGARLLRGQRRPRSSCLHGLRLDTAAAGDGRLLGRPGRRLCDPPEPEPARVRRAHGRGHERRPEPGVLAPAGTIGRARRGLPVPRSARPRASALASTSRTVRDLPGHTTSRCGSRARARRATDSRSSRAEAFCAGSPPLPVPVGFEELVLGYVSKDARRVSDDDDARRHVLRDDGSGSDERLLADLDAGAQDRAAPDACTAADRRALASARAAARSGP